jgi:hypothetical protein
VKEETINIVIDEVEKQRILKDLEKTYTERFRMLMQLIRFQKILDKATIIHKP